jgi:hypothetical protein
VAPSGYHFRCRHPVKIGILLSMEMNTERYWA